MRLFSLLVRQIDKEGKVVERNGDSPAASDKKIAALL